MLHLIGTVLCSIPPTTATAQMELEEFGSPCSEQCARSGLLLTSLPYAPALLGDLSGLFLPY